ncbi:jg12006 [Pararge aegeria aegeria]|uniref:Jg12006 protein n=1 Tax=Pararge aegeria aegeria TaxID=348720 RepID=A0A8S4R876_9NEOP|nr:jg12006 [Pararge aegeria aegeria]
MMRSQLWIAVYAILLAGVSSSGNTIQAPLPIHTSLKVGHRLIAKILTFNDTVRKCYLVSPSGSKVEFKPNDESNAKIVILSDTDTSQCRASITIDENAGGLWTLKSEADGGRERIQIYNVTVTSETDSESNPYVEYLDNKFINTTFGSVATIALPDYAYGDTVRCQIVKPDGNMYNVQELDDNHDEFISKVPSTNCAVLVNVTSEKVIGKWMLISEGFELSGRFIRKLPFEISIEESVDAGVGVMNVKEGNTMFIALRNNLSGHHVETCRLLGPHGIPPAHYNRLNNICGFRVGNVTTNDSGYWEIYYGDTIKYRAFIEVIVHGAPSTDQINLYWTKDKPVDVTIGPENAIYCRVKNPAGFEVYNGFRRCTITLDRVIKSQHEGLWKLDVGLPGQVLTHSYNVKVEVKDAARKPHVSTWVSVRDMSKKTVTLSCFLASPHPIRSCKFRDPSGRILIATEGVGESRYISWQGTGVNYTAGVHQHDCNIRIMDSTVSDIGIWRCAIETEGDNYYGFLTVKGSWIRDPEIIAAITLKPTLSADRSFITSSIQDSVTMTCSIQAPIRYCYFRSRNGTLFNVAPSGPHDLATYVGAGLDAGECGIRFPSLATSDSGYWSCHVGLVDPEAKEQRARIEVAIYDVMVVSQQMRDNKLTLEAQVYNERPLEYCRFVRIDGFGFTSTNVPETISNSSNLSTGLCAISIRNPTSLEQHPWAIVARIKGQETEVTRFTDIAFPVPSPPGNGEFRIPGAWIIVMSIGMCMILLASFIGPKKNREWTYARASSIRNSFMKKKVIQNANDTSNNTAVAA